MKGILYLSFCQIEKPLVLCIGTKFYSIINLKIKPNVPEQQKIKQLGEKDTHNPSLDVFGCN